MTGSRTWFFPDGELPPPGAGELQGHESLIILNPNPDPATVTLTLYWTDRDPVSFTVAVGGERVRCLRTNEPADMGGLELPLEVQYAIGLVSDVGIIAQYGRLDVRQANMAFYSATGYHESGEPPN